MHRLLPGVIIVLAMALCCPALAQGPGAGGRGLGPGGGPMLYNPQTVTTVTGQVQSLEEFPPQGMAGRRGRLMMHLVADLKTDQGVIPVHLGPTWYMDHEKFAVKVGDQMEVTGSKVTWKDQPAIVAKEIKVGGKTLKLRDEKGMPAWRGGLRPGRQ